MRQVLEETLLNGVTTGTSAAVDLRGQMQDVTVYAEWTSGATAGVVTIETAAHPTYAGTWASLGTLAVAAGATNLLSVTGAALRAVRARVSTAVVGGTVTVRLVAHG